MKVLSMKNIECIFIIFELGQVHKVQKSFKAGLLQMRVQHKKSPNQGQHIGLSFLERYLYSK